MIGSTLSDEIKINKVESTKKGNTKSLKTETEINLEDRHEKKTQDTELFFWLN